MQFLIALKMYAKGHGDKGKLTWTPNPSITAALNEAFKHSFKNVMPTNKRYLLALDVSGSMTCSTVCGVECLTACEVSAAMSMIIAAAEPHCDVMGFANRFKPLNVRPDRPLQDNLREVQDNNFGSTDCSLPMTWALENKKSYDAMIVFTDNETNMNRMRPVDALRRYNETMGLNCKLIVVATSVTNFTIADPDDPNMLDICGFDASTPLCISEFVGPSP
jgi:60 kDa SS-A/Ro ribonucleoprotein